MSLANKWRPQDFADVVGQTNTIQPLLKSIEANKLHHAYLFTGTRGCGKTSLARIMAMAINCEVGISPTPCHVCASCIGIKNGKHIDVIELDAASKTKVEDIRELLENVSYAPVNSRYKVYIIDEVHMLSNHSFNALLKTLEEPPSHVKFLLATTDPDKIPITILSRCLQFNLSRIKQEDIVNNLKKILDNEQVKFEDDALYQIAVLADGSMRDALSLVEQVIVSTDCVDSKTINSILGIVSDDILISLLVSISNSDPNSTLEISNKICRSAIDISSVIKKIQKLVYDMLLLKCVPTITNHSSKLLSLLDKFSSEQLQVFYELLVKGQRDLQFAPDLKVGFEIIILRMLEFCPVTINREITKQNSTAKVPYEPKEETTPVKPQNTNIEDWDKFVSSLAVTGFAKTVVDNCVLVNSDNNQLLLNLDPGKQSFLNPARIQKIEQAINDKLDSKYKLDIQVAGTKQATPDRNRENNRKLELDRSKQEFLNDPDLQSVINSFDGTIQEIV